MKKAVTCFVLGFMVFCFSSSAFAESIYNLTNNSGGTLTSGTLVIIDSSANDSFTTTTTATHAGMFGVIPFRPNGDSISIADGSRGPVQISGVVEITCDEAITRFDYISTSTSAAGQGTGDASQPTRFIGIALETDNSSPYNPTVLLTPSVQTVISDHGALSGLADDDHTQYGALAQDETIAGNWVNTANPWADNEVSDTITVGAAGSVNDSALSANVAHLNAAETISANWVNTTNPWADNEVSDTLTVGAAGSVDDSALSANVAHLNAAETISSNWVNTANPWADNEVSDTISVGAGGSVDDGALSANVALATGDVYTGDHDFGGAEFEMPNGTDSTVMDTLGEIYLDSNGNGAALTGFVFAIYDTANGLYAPLIDAQDMWGIADGEVVTYDSATNKFIMETPPGAAGGEANTYSNSGAGGVGVILTKAGVDLPFKSINAGSAAVTVTNDAGNSEVDIDIATDGVDDTHIDWGSGANQVDLADIPGGTAGASDFDFGGASNMQIPNAEGDATLAAAGDIAGDGVDDAIAYHFGAGGEIVGEAQISGLHAVSVSFDPGSHYDLDTRYRLFSIDDEAPNGITIVEWKVDFGMNPDVEANLNLCYADDWAGTNETVIDILDTTDGTATEDTNANINGGAAVANGKYLYLLFDADPEGTGDYMTFEFWYYAEED